MESDNEFTLNNRIFVNLTNNIKDINSELTFCYNLLNMIFFLMLINLEMNYTQRPIGGTENMQTVSSTER